MTEKESRQLQVGDNVSSDQLPPGEHHTGHVTETNYHAVKMRWDDGQVGIVHHLDMATIDRCAKVTT